VDRGTLARVTEMIANRIGMAIQRFRLNGDL
jgi:hypothetical protein